MNNLSKSHTVSRGHHRRLRHGPRGLLQTTTQVTSNKYIVYRYILVYCIPLYPCISTTAISLYIHYRYIHVYCILYTGGLKLSNGRLGPS